MVEGVQVCAFFFFERIIYWLQSYACNLNIKNDHLELLKKEKKEKLQQNNKSNR